MKFFEIKRETKTNIWLSNIALTSLFLWLFIVFVLRRVFLFYHFDLFLLGILPNFFAGLGVYLILLLKGRSKPVAALLTFGSLAFAEIIQLFTPRTFDLLDLIASLVGIAIGELLYLLVNRTFTKNK